MVHLTWISQQKDADNLSPLMLFLQKCNTCFNGVGISAGSVSRLMDMHPLYLHRIQSAAW